MYEPNEISRSDIKLLGIVVIILSSTFYCKNIRIKFVEP